MTKEEQLKIYAAYFPYGLEARVDKDTYLQPDSERIGKVTQINLEHGNYELVITAENGYYLCDLDQAKPILYDLSYLTKEIEGGVFLINEIANVISPDQSFSIIQNEDMIILDFDEEYTFHTLSVKNMMRQPYEIIQILLKHHFNVFNLSEDQYINKATLTNKS
ncbi:hypothetical protein [Chryseobacterium lathyri]|uniref:hypothetical protein n=1 Tax=Chryseobacterium lathyri TaxID=395933 RepID=UPI001CBED484|nr:hypothetical protein [Chryseobacterium lathyri]